MVAARASQSQMNLLPLAGFLLGLRRLRYLDLASCPLTIPWLTSRRAQFASELVSESDMVDSEDGGVTWLALPGGDKVSCHGGREV